MEDQSKNNALRRLPSVSKLLASKAGEKLIALYGKGLTTFGMRAAIAETREFLLGGGGEVPSEEEVLAQVERDIHSLVSPEGRTAINAAGIILHTGLGRAPLSKPAVQALSQCSQYTILEVDRASGERNKREVRAEELLQELTNCESATVVNNCAAAIFLALSAVASPGEVIISRGQLVEIGGSYRMPDVMTASGCTLHEIGTTNRTSIEDYRRAVNEKTSAILIVSQSNFRIKGFTHAPSLEEITALGKEKNIPVLYDLGGGSLVPLERYGFSHETTVQEAIAAGVDIVCFSGDKLIGGPQAGILCGKKLSINKARKSSYFRMFRPDKLTFSALEATLVSFLNDSHTKDIPLYQMACTSLEELRKRGQDLLQSLQGIDGFDLSLVEDLSYLGGGSLPDEALPSIALRLQLRTEDERKRNRFSNTLAKRLRLSEPAVFARIEAGAMIFNLRTVFPDEIPPLGNLLRAELERL